jgi:uncharacterized protein YidB (DUF937 family)
MGLMDELNLGGALKGALGQLEAAALPTLLNSVLAKTEFGDLNGLLAKLKEGGLDAEVKSWLGNGANMPVTADQLRTILSNTQVQELARHFGVPVDALLKVLAESLPAAVDKASSDGTLKPPA